MGLNNIRLTPPLLTTLYSDVLVEMPATAMPSPSPGQAGGRPQHPSGTATLCYLGKNEKKILVLTAAPDAVYLPEEELSFLTAVLGACQLSLADVAIVNWLNTEKDYQKITETLESKTVLLFDLDPLSFGLPINFPPFQVQEFAGRTYVYAPSLRAIEGNKDLKKNLWNTLKKIFAL